MLEYLVYKREVPRGRGGRKGHNVTLTTEGNVLVNDILVPLPELIVAIVTKNYVTSAISVKGNVYNIYKYGVGRLKIPSYVIDIRYTPSGCLALTETGRIYYDKSEEKWRLLEGINNVTKVVFNSGEDSTVYIFSDRWYILLSNADDRIIVLPLSEKIDDIFVDDEDMVAMMVEGECFYP